MVSIVFAVLFVQGVKGIPSLYLATKTKSIKQYTDVYSPQV